MKHLKTYKIFESTKNEIIPLDVIKTIIDFHYNDDLPYENVYDTILTISRENLEFLKNESLDYIKNGPFSFDGNLYRGIKIFKGINPGQILKMSRCRV